MQDIAILLLSEKGVETAKRLSKTLSSATIWGLDGRVKTADKFFENTGEQIRSLYNQGTTIIGLMATGILIRALAPCLENKREEPPVLAVSDDGSIIIPLLGGLTGANELALELADKLSATPAITASGARHFGIQLEAPPKGYELVNPEDAKRVTSDILNGKFVKLEGHSNWLSTSALPFDHQGEVSIRVSIYEQNRPEDGLLYHPKTVMVLLDDAELEATAVSSALRQKNISIKSLAAIIVTKDGPVVSARQVASSLQVPLRLLSKRCELEAMECETITKENDLLIVNCSTPSDISLIGQRPGKISVVGLGPGKESWRTDEVKKALSAADILVGYKTYIDMVPKSEGQERHASDNRVELERAREALDLAKEGHHVVVVSSGDPGIFAMASAVIEALEQDPGRWQTIEFEVLPGLSAMQGAASLIGAPLGHDFAVISLSDIRKPFEVIAERLIAAAKSDMVIAIYNPASKTRRDQVKRMQELLIANKPAETLVLIAKNVGRDGEITKLTNLEQLNTDEIDMRTLLIIGSSKTKTIKGPAGKTLIYTPRTYQ